MTLNTLIEENIICSEGHRQFFKEQIGPAFHFNVPFQKWLKENSGKSYHEAIKVYYRILDQPQEQISQQFEYNQYIKDFFAANKGRSLACAIECWKYKKSLPGHPKYEKKDLEILDEKND